ncbi:LORF2 protein, partial [Crocuta crocuta]
HCLWECKPMQPLWKTGWRFLTKLKIELPYDPAITLLGIYPKDKKCWFKGSICVLMFIAALSTIAKVWKETINTMKYYSAVKRNETLSFATTWMEMEGIMLSKISQRKTYMMIALLGGI